MANHNPSAEADRQIAHAESLEREIQEKRHILASKIAAYRWYLATQHHRMDNGQPLNFERYPFHEEIFKSDAFEMTLIGATGNGKSEILTVDDITKAAIGLKVFHVFDSAKTREKFVLSRMNVCIHSVPIYKELLDSSAERIGGEPVDSSRFKHFGDGSINFVGSNVRSDFSNYRVDAANIDEYQLCDRTNLPLIFGRMNASDWRYYIRVGNPLEPGTEENQNIDWFFQQSDQRHWEVMCGHCQMYQELGWWEHFVDDVKGEQGQLADVRPKDKDWKPDSEIEFRPICKFCKNKMVRMTKSSRWKAYNPSSPRRGYKFSNLFNPAVNIVELFAKYKEGIVNPSLMGQFVNNQLGLPHNSSGKNINEEMLEKASTGDSAGIPTYSLIPIRELEYQWRQLEEIKVG